MKPDTVTIPVTLTFDPAGQELAELARHIVTRLTDEGALDEAAEHGHGIMATSAAIEWARERLGNQIPDVYAGLTFEGAVAMPINPDDHTTWTLEQLLEHGSTAELEELLWWRRRGEAGHCALSRNEAERVAEELERRRAPAPGLELATATPWQPGDVELDDELELVAGAVHLLARRAAEHGHGIMATAAAIEWASHVGSAAAELAEIRRRFGINVARDDGLIVDAGQGFE